MNKIFQDEFFLLYGRVNKLLINSCEVKLINGLRINARFSGKLKCSSVRLNIGDIVLVEINLHFLKDGCRVITKYRQKQLY